MKDQKSLILGIAIAISTFAIFAFGAPSTAFAQIGGGQCSSDSQCFQTMICEYGECIEGCRNDFGCPNGYVCDTTSNYCVQPDTCEGFSYGQSFIIAPTSLGLAVGDVVQPVSSLRNTSSSDYCSYESSCSTSYSSAFNVNATCGNGYQCVYDVKGPGTPTLQHSAYLGTGKYEIIEVLGTCDSSGDKIYKIKGCNC